MDTAQRLIRTVHGRGFRFVGEVAGNRSSAACQAQSWMLVSLAATGSSEDEPPSACGWTCGEAGQAHRQGAILAAAARGLRRPCRRGLFGEPRCWPGQPDRGAIPRSSGTCIASSFWRRPEAPATFRGLRRLPGDDRAARWRVHDGLA